MLKNAYEVYSLIGGGYNKRHVHGHAWTKKLAQELADTLAPRRYYIGVIHLILVNGNWHRLAVLPVESIAGNPEDAEDSRVARGDLVARSTPGMFVQIDEGQPFKLSLDIEKAIDIMASNGKTRVCKLYTIRTGGNLPLSFTVSELRTSETKQAEVYAWLKHEIDFRKSKGETT